MEEQFGNAVILRYKRTQEIFSGIIVDGDKHYFIIEMDEEVVVVLGKIKASVKGTDLYIDTRYDKDWDIIQVLYNYNRTIH